MDRRLVFEIRGSAPEPYIIVATRAEDRFWITCTCPAGENGSHCKHRMALLAGVVDDLASSNPDEVSYLSGMMKGTPLDDLVEEFHLATREFESAKRRLDKIRSASTWRCWAGPSRDGPGSQRH